MIFIFIYIYFVSAPAHDFDTILMIIRITLLVLFVDILFLIVWKAVGRKSIGKVMSLDVKSNYLTNSTYLN